MEKWGGGGGGGGGERCCQLGFGVGCRRGYNLLGCFIQFKKIYKE